MKAQSVQKTNAAVNLSDVAINCTDVAAIYPNDASFCCDDTANRSDDASICSVAAANLCNNTAKCRCNTANLCDNTAQCRCNAAKYRVVAVILAFLALSCDSGDIYPDVKRVEEMQKTVLAEFQFENTAAFPQNYRVVWGTFVGSSPYPLDFEEISGLDGTQWNATPLNSIPRGADRIALALMEKTDNKVLHVFHEVHLDDAPHDLNISETVDLAAFSRVQAQVFSPQCIHCHGAGGVAANLDLTADHAYTQLVGVPSNTSNSPKARVAKHSLQNSFLLDVLSSRPETITTNHTTLSTLDADDDIQLIRAWIMSENF